MSDDREHYVVELEEPEERPPMPVQGANGNEIDWQGAHDQVVIAFDAYASRVNAKKEELQTTINGLEDEVAQLQKRLDIRETISTSFHKTTSYVGQSLKSVFEKPAKRIGNVLKYPIAWSAYAAGGPVTAGLHHAFAKDHYEKTWGTDGNQAWGYVVGTVATLATIWALNGADEYYTNFHTYENVVENILTTVPCEEGEGAPVDGTRTCSSVHIPQISYLAPWLLGSDEGIGPYTLHRALNTKVKDTVLPTGTAGIEICTQFITVVQDAQEDTPTDMSSASSRTHKWNCTFTPS